MDVDLQKWLGTLADTRDRESRSGAMQVVQTTEANLAPTTVMHLEASGSPGRWPLRTPIRRTSGGGDSRLTWARRLEESPSGLID